MEYHSAIKKEQINVICSNMDEPKDYQTVCSELDTESKYHMILLTCGA